MKSCLILLLCLSATLAADIAGTPQNIRSDWIKRCNEFQKSSAIRGAYGRKWVARKCSDVADKFIGGFKYKGPCDVPADAYLKGIQYSMQPMLDNKLALWSGLHDYSLELGRVMGLYTMERGTLPGFLANGINFCGQTRSPGINYHSCPGWGSCRKGHYDAMQRFWLSVSRALAMNARGVVSVLLRGSGNRPAFRLDSVAAKEELPNLNPRFVPKIKVLLVHVPGERVYENCNGASLKLMERHLPRGIRFECEDDPRPIHEYLCKVTRKC